MTGKPLGTRLDAPVELSVLPGVRLGGNAADVLNRKNPILRLVSVRQIALGMAGLCYGIMKAGSPEWVVKLRKL